MKALLLTGRPGIDKTAVIRRVANALVGERIVGFYTEEQRSRGSRNGFRIVTLDGRSRQVAFDDVRGKRGRMHGASTNDVAAALLWVREARKLGS